MKCLLQWDETNGMGIIGHHHGMEMIGQRHGIGMISQLQ